jgi:peptidoglycan/xylan/chitin deacetylase (PgdA/CDA1 family)
MYLTETPSFIQFLFPNLTWRIPSTSNKLYLTFDDGPIPDVTEWVLDILHQYQAKATFFCVGENVSQHPTIFSRIEAEGHSVGNHTYHHKNGWHTSKNDYLDDVRKCAQVVDSNLFRPPYGKVKPNQLKALKLSYQIVMWDILTGDFDAKNNLATCFQNIINNTKPGSILVLHDSLKAKPILHEILPMILQHYSELGFTFEAIPMKPVQIHIDK